MLSDLELVSSIYQLVFLERRHLCTITPISNFPFSVATTNVDFLTCKKCLTFILLASGKRKILHKEKKLKQKYPTHSTTYYHGSDKLQHCRSKLRRHNCWSSNLIAECLLPLEQVYLCFLIYFLIQYNIFNLKLNKETVYSLFSILHKTPKGGNIYLNKYFFGSSSMVHFSPSILFLSLLLCF